MIILLLAASAFAFQGDKRQRIYLDKFMEPCGKGKAAFYKEAAGQDGNLYKVVVRTLDGTLKAEGTCADPALEVDVFVTDVVMPGMDGPTWVKRALEDRPDVRVVFVSGYAEDVLSADQARIPNSVFLPKPFSLNDLTQTVQGTLQASH